MSMPKQILVLSAELDLSKESMNVRELIDHLKLFPQQMRVHIGTGYGQTPLVKDKIVMDEK